MNIPLALLVGGLVISGVVGYKLTMKLIDHDIKRRIS